MIQEPQNDDCPALEILADVVWPEGALSARQRERLLAHGEICAKCGALLEIFTGLFKLGYSKRRALEGPSEQEQVELLKDIEKAKAEYLSNPDMQREWDRKMSGCLSDSRLIEALEAASASSRNDLEEHLSDCLECRARYKLVRELDRMSLSPRSILVEKTRIPRMRVFMDESGSETPGIYVDSRQPSLCVAGVITTQDGIENIDSVRGQLMSNYSLPETTEIHADPCLRREGDYQSLTTAQAEQLLREFIERNFPNFLFFYAPSMLKPFVREEVRLALPTRGLSQYTAVFAHHLWTIGKYLEHEVGAEFDLAYDENDAVAEDLPRVARVLQEHPNPKVRITNMVGEPIPTKSHLSAGIQLADVIAFYMARHGQIEIPKFDHGEHLDRHKDKILRVHNELLREKNLPWFTGEFCLKIDAKAFTQTRF